MPGFFPRSGSENTWIFFRDLKFCGNQVYYFSPVFHGGKPGCYRKGRITVRFYMLLFCIALTVIGSGCTTPWVTNTQRSAVEQYLIATTVERAVANAGLWKFAGKKVFLDYGYLAPQVDKAYVQGMLEMELSKAGCVIVAKQELAEIMIQPLCGVLATDHDSWIIGTPSLPIPVPYTDLTFAVPEIPLLKRVKRMAYGHFAFNVFNAGDRAPIATVSNINSSAQYNNWVVLLVPFTSHNMDMKDTVNASTVYEF